MTYVNDFLKKKVLKYFGLKLVITKFISHLYFYHFKSNTFQKAKSKTIKIGKQGYHYHLSKFKMP